MPSHPNYAQFNKTNNKNSIALSLLVFLMKSFFKKTAARMLVHGRQILGLPPRNIHEAKFRLLAEHNKNKSISYGKVMLPWGMVEYTDSGAICQQLQSIYFDKIYQFDSTPVNGRPIRIVDCGSNIGISAIWFLQNYPGCELTCYEADERLVKVAKGNIQRAGFSGDHVVNAAVWTEDGKIGFAGSGDDKGSVSNESEKSVDCIDLSRAIPEETDLLKMDIEGAEFPVLKKLFDSGAIDRVQRIAVELHDVDARLAEFAQLLTAFENAGFFVRFRGGNLPWLEAKAATPMDFPSISNGPLYYDFYATKVG
jgi:FkbM family methyltransferase